MRKVLLLVVASLSLVTCGGGGSSGGSLCQQIGAAICQKACACREGPTCAIGGGGGFELTFPSEADCRGLYVSFGCTMGDMAAYNDAMACLPLVQAATCTGSGTTGALSFPTDPVCDAPQ